jgi:hypothetical protein
MNAGRDEAQSSEEEWSWTAGPAIPEADGRIWVKLLAYDGEYAVSYVYEHPSITSPGNLIYEVDAWLADLWRAPDENLYAAGEGGAVHVFDGKTWRRIQTPERAMLSSVWGPDEEMVYATGEGVILQRQGGSWVYASRGHGGYIDRLRGIARDDLYAVGRFGLMLHFDGAKWERLDVPTNVHLNGVFAVDPKTVYAVGAEGIVLVGSPGTWKALNLGEIDFVDVAEYQGRIYLAATEQGLFRLEEEQLIPIRSDVRATRLTNASGFLCVAGNLSIHRFDGVSWESYNYTVSP